MWDGTQTKGQMNGGEDFFLFSCPWTIQNPATAKMKNNFKKERDERRRPA